MAYFVLDGAANSAFETIILGYYVNFYPKS